MVEYYSKSFCIDFFLAVDTMRHADETQITKKFSEAYEESPDIAMKILFWARDIRHGAGDRRLFRLCISWLAANYPISVIKNISHIPEFGRWDDVVILFDNSVNKDVKAKSLDVIANALNANDALCAKWMPRKGFLAKQMRDAFKLTPKAWRKKLVKLTRVVETQMCANNFELIDFNYVPSIARTRYRKSFYDHDKNRFYHFVQGAKNKKHDPLQKTYNGYSHDMLMLLLSNKNVPAYFVMSRTITNERYDVISS